MWISASLRHHAGFAATNRRTVSTKLELSSKLMESIFPGASASVKAKKVQEQAKSQRQIWHKLRPTCITSSSMAHTLGTADGEKSMETCQSCVALTV